MVTAKVLGPADYGLLKILQLVPTLQKFGDIGLGGVAEREIPHLRGKRSDERHEKKIKSTAFTVSIFWALFLSSIVVCVSFGYKNPVIRYGLWIASLGLFIGQINRLHVVVCSVDKRFGLIAQIGIIQSVIHAFVVVGLVCLLRVYGVLISGVISGACALYWYRKKLALDFEFSIQKKELFRQLKIGLPLAAGTAAFGLFSWVERIQVISLLGSEKLGYYAFCLFIFQPFALFINNILRASKIHLYERLGGNMEESVMSMMSKSTIVMAFSLSFVIGVLWLFIPLVVNLFFQEYEVIIELLPWMGVTLVISGIAAFPLTAMNSARLNMQIQFAFLWLLTTGLFVILSIIGVQLGWGLQGIAAAKMIALGIRAVIGFCLTSAYLFAGIKDGLLLFGKAILPVAFVIVIVYFLNEFWSSWTWKSTAMKCFVFSVTCFPGFLWLDKQAQLRALVGLRTFNRGPKSD